MQKRQKQKRRLVGTRAASWGAAFIYFLVVVLGALGPQRGTAESAYTMTQVTKTDSGINHSAKPVADLGERFHRWLMESIYFRELKEKEMQRTLDELNKIIQEYRDRMEWEKWLDEQGKNLIPPGHDIPTVFPGSGDLVGGGNLDGSLEIFRAKPVGSTVQFEQLTSGTGCTSTSPSAAADASRIAFTSNCDHTGSNADKSIEIFDLDVASQTIRQLTSSSAIVTSPSIAASGDRLAFASTGNPTGTNADGSFEIFLIKDLSGTPVVEQLTSGAGCSSGSPSMNVIGTHVAFASSCNPTGNNPDGNTETFLARLNPLTITQLTTSTGCDNSKPTINADGTRVAFQSDCNLTGDNSDGNQEIYSYDTTTGLTTQLTTSSGCTSVAPSSNATGRRVAFESTCNLTGENADGSREVFVAVLGSVVLSQVTASSGCSSFTPSITGKGTHVAFHSTCNPTGENADGNSEIFVALSPFIPISVNIQGTGAGTVRSVAIGVITCSTGNAGTCEEKFLPGATLRFTATPTGASSFGGWGDDCAPAGTSSTCTVRLPTAGTASVTATFTAAPVSTALLAALLPASRAVEIGIDATVFATVINIGQETATDCQVIPNLNLLAAFTYQTTDSASNALTGTPNTPFNIVAGAAQSLLLALNPAVPLVPTDVPFTFACSNTAAAPSFSGLNTLLLAAFDSPGPDIIALGDTPSHDGILTLASVGAFGIATVNVGASGLITVTPDTGSVTLPLSLTVCQTDPATAACLAPPAPSVTTQIEAAATPTFSIFADATGPIPFDPATNRLFVRFTDAGGVTRGATSVAVRTVP